MKNLFLNGLKIGLFFNFLTVAFLTVYVLAVENLLTRPFAFKSPIELGTIVSGGRMFSLSDTTNYKPLPNWSLVESKFSIFIPENQFRADWKQPAPRLESWCKNHNCCVHRINFSDKRKVNFKCFTLDDWFINNRKFLNFPIGDISTIVLDDFLNTLSKGDRIIISEPSGLFNNPNTFDAFERWVLTLIKKHPTLKFEVAIQIHLQWIDSFWGYSNVTLSKLSKFSEEHHIPWGISEFSIYDRIWKRRLSSSGDNPIKFLSYIESIIPDRFRHAVVLHQAYLVHYETTRLGAKFIIEWGNFPAIWFTNEIDSNYQSTFALFDWSGKPLPMYWAITRGISDGKNLGISQKY